MAWNIPNIIIEAQKKSGGGGGTSDYSDLSNKPQINSVTLSGNKTLSDLGIASADTVSGIQGVIPDDASTSNKLVTADDLPGLATTSAPGLVQPDGTTVIISDGVISAVGGGGGNYSYLTTELSYTNCEYVAGGYFKIGNVVFINLRVKCTDESTSSFRISGLPTYRNKTVNNKNIVSVSGYDMTAENNVYAYGAIGQDGIMGIRGTLINGNEYTLHAIYLCD